MASKFHNNKILQISAQLDKMFNPTKNEKYMEDLEKTKHDIREETWNIVIVSNVITITFVNSQIFNLFKVLGVCQGLE